MRYNSWTKSDEVSEPIATPTVRIPPQGPLPRLVRLVKPSKFYRARVLPPEDPAKTRRAIRRRLGLDEATGPA